MRLTVPCRLLIFVCLSGEVLECNAETNIDLFNAGRCNLGALGFISEVTLKVESEFKLRAVQTLEDLDDVLDRLGHVAFSSQHTRFWWIPHTDKIVLWKANVAPFEVSDILECFCTPGLPSYLFFRVLIKASMIGSPGKIVSSIIVTNLYYIVREYLPSLLD